MRHPVYLVGYRVRSKVYWVATDRPDLSAEQIAFIYSLHWEIETLFGWWKRHLKVYHFISRNPHGLLLQLLAGLITYLLLILYCHRLYGEKKPSIRRLQELRWRIRQETAGVIYIINVEIDIEVLARLLLFYIHAIFSPEITGRHWRNWSTKVSVWLPLHRPISLRTPCSRPSRSPLWQYPPH